MWDCCRRKSAPTASCSATFRRPSATSGWSTRPGPSPRRKTAGPWAGPREGPAGWARNNGVRGGLDLFSSRLVYQRALRSAQSLQEGGRMTYQPDRRFRSPIVGDLNLPPHGGEETASAAVDPDEPVPMLIELNVLYPGGLLAVRDAFYRLWQNYVAQAGGT